MTPIVRLLRDCATGAVHTTNDFLPRIDEGDFFRASGDCVCSWCGKTYRDHPRDPYERAIDSAGGEYGILRVLCDGTRVKL